ncbi:MAG: hypothetical protein WKG01_11440 [Kofleriaceae bacterium]
MEDYADIYYVDSRNAVIRDHRPGSHGPGRPQAVWNGTRPVTVPPRTVYVPPGQSGWAPASHSGWGPATPPYQQPPVIWAGPPVQSTVAGILGKLTTGQIVDMVAQVWAALQSLPAAPVGTGEPSSDVGNLILYQSALAQHAKRDEQVRTLGSLVARLVG